MLNSPSPAPAAPRLSLKDAVAKHSKGEMIVIDVRERAEINSTGTPKGAIHIPLSLIPLKANPKAVDYDNRLDPSKTVGVLCASGGRSGVAVQAMKQMGYADVHNLGGFGDWCAAGGPVSR